MRAARIPNKQDGAEQPKRKQLGQTRQTLEKEKVLNASVPLVQSILLKVVQQTQKSSEKVLIPAEHDQYIFESF